jgi:hypothetical protein
MATAYKNQSYHRDRGYSQSGLQRTPVQKVCLGIGVIFIVIGLAGILMPGLMGMHLSITHDLIHLASGALALWVGSSRYPSRAYAYCIAFGSVYGLLGLAGFFLGTPGYPGVGHMEADQNLLRIIPNVFELGTIDHIFHIMLSAVLLFTAYAWKRASREVSQEMGRHTVETQSGINRQGLDRDLNPERGENVDHRNMKVRKKNGEVNIFDAELGNIDMDRDVDRKRREDFERRL